jgi:hypothetical protein
MTNPDAARSNTSESKVFAAPVTSRFHTTPRLMITNPLDLPAIPRATVANLALPTARVQQRAAILVRQATTSGRGHSMRLWRMALQTALQELAREASGLPASAACRTLTWEARGEAYHVMATFAPSATIH